MAIINNGRITAKLPKADQLFFENLAKDLGIKVSELVREALAIAKPNLMARLQKSEATG